MSDPLIWTILDLPPCALLRRWLTASRDDSQRQQHCSQEDDFGTHQTISLPHAHVSVGVGPTTSILARPPYRTLTYLLHVICPTHNRGIKH